MRIILADPNNKSRWALKTLLEEEPGMEVIGEADNAKQLKIELERACADLILIDRKLPGSDMRSLITGLHALKPKPTVVMMSTNQEDSRLLLSVGADAFVSKGEQPDWLLETLRQYAMRSTKLNNIN